MCFCIGSSVDLSCVESTHVIPGHICKHADANIQGLKTRAVVADDSLGMGGNKGDAVEGGDLLFT